MGILGYIPYSGMQDFISSTVGFRVYRAANATEQRCFSKDFASQQRPQQACSEDTPLEPKGLGVQGLV